MMTYRAAIFDLDGTLIDSIRDIGEAMNRTLRSMNYPTYELDQYRYLVGEGVRQLVERALPEDARSADQVDAFLKQYRKDYGQSWNVHTRPYPGILTLLDDLQAHEIQLGVLSNKPDAVTRQCVSYFFPDVPFVVVAGQKDDVPRKPNPAAAIHIAEAMQVPPEACVFVGDTATDMETAVAAGMFPAGVTWGFRDRNELESSGARLIALKAEALLGLFIHSHQPSLL